MIIKLHFWPRGGGGGAKRIFTKPSRNNHMYTNVSENITKLTTEISARGASVDFTTIENPQNQTTLLIQE